MSLQLALPSFRPGLHILALHTQFLGEIPQSLRLGLMAHLDPSSLFNQQLCLRPCLSNAFAHGPLKVSADRVLLGVGSESRLRGQ